MGRIKAGRRAFFNPSECGIIYREVAVKIKDRLEMINKTIMDATSVAKREPGSVRLVAVSKTHPAASILEAYDAGQIIFAESRIQDAKQKIEEITKPIEWHLIGHLQSNKAKLAVQLFDTIHSVDSIKLIQELNKRAEQLDKMVNILLQVNVSGELSKHGMAPTLLQNAIDTVLESRFLRLKGLMTMPPFSSNPEDSRPFFAELREMAFDRLVKSGIIKESDLELSMGMSGDFQVAIEEGATLVRIGTAIFGTR